MDKAAKGTNVYDGMTAIIRHSAVIFISIIQELAHVAKN